MMIVYSKQTNKIINIATGDCYKSIKDLYPYDFEDFELIYDFIIMDDDELVINNIDMFYILDKKLYLKENKFSKYVKR